MILESKYDVGDYVQAYINTAMLWIKMQHKQGVIVEVHFQDSYFWYIAVEDPENVQQYHINQAVGSASKNYHYVEYFIAREHEIEGIIEQ